MHPIAYRTRCPICGQRLTAVDDYGDYNVLVKRNGTLVRKSEARWFDPDFVIDQHIRSAHKG